LTDDNPLPPVADFGVLLPLRILPVVPAIATSDAALRLAEAFCQAGPFQIEITFRSAVAPDALRQVVRKFPGMTVGAGTLLCPDQVLQAVDAGAHFGVAPGANPQVIKAAREVRLPFLPGVATPSEIEAVLEEGHLWQKIPGELGNFEALLGWIEVAYGHTGLRLVPAGGVALKELPRFLQKPIIGAMAGIWVTPVALLQEERWDEIRALAGRLVSLLAREDALTDTTKRCAAEGVVGAQQTI
jgi:2-dehydro-3-deoxyphosphogluconate aldolase/(4S)-4-hydroxy-2-oxoglutarate aldolase